MRDPNINRFNLKAKTVVRLRPTLQKTNKIQQTNKNISILSFAISLILINMKTPNKIKMKLTHNTEKPALAWPELDLVTMEGEIC